MKLAKIIDDRVKELNLSYYRLSKISGVPLNTLYSIKNGVRKVLTLRNTIKIFDALELDLNELKKIDWKWRMITIELAQAINEDRKRVFGSYAFAPDMVTQVLRIRAELEQEINADTRKNV